MIFSVIIFSASQVILAQTVQNSGSAYMAVDQFGEPQAPQITSEIFRVADDAHDPCSWLVPPSWCVFNVRPDGSLMTPYGPTNKDWSGVLKKFKKDFPDSIGPVLKDPAGNAYQLKLK